MCVCGEVELAGLGRSGVERNLTGKVEAAKCELVLWFCGAKVPVQLLPCSI